MNGKDAGSVLPLLSLFHSFQSWLPIIRSHYKLTADENGCLAVLHNRNKMVTAFGNSECATESEGAVLSKSVTSCAGMTARPPRSDKSRVPWW